jgi:hypothetical protein
LFFVMELVPHGDLLDFILKHGAMDEVYIYAVVL